MQLNGKRHRVLCSGCRGNNALYQVAQLAVRPELNLADVTNFSSVSFSILYACSKLAFCMWLLVILLYTLFGSK